MHFDVNYCVHKGKCLKGMILYITSYVSNYIHFPLLFLFAFVDFAITFTIILCLAIVLYYYSIIIMSLFTMYNLVECVDNPVIFGRSILQKLKLRI